MFFFGKKKKVKQTNKVTTKKKVSAMDDKQKILLMIRKMRSRINPDILNKAESVALGQIGEGNFVPPENEASRLFKLAMQNNGARRSEILTLVGKKS
jgi:hypothetical protein